MTDNIVESALRNCSAKGVPVLNGYYATHSGDQRNMDEIRAAFRVADNPTLTFYAGARAAAAGVWSLAALGVTGMVSIVSQ